MRTSLALLLSAALLATGLLSGCAECTYDTECPDAQVCAAGSCQDPDLAEATLGVCTEDGDCAWGEQCLNGTCVWQGE